MVTTTPRKAFISPSASLSARILFTLGWFSHNGSYIFNSFCISAFSGGAIVSVRSSKSSIQKSPFKETSQQYTLMAPSRRHQGILLTYLLLLLAAARGTGTLGDLSCRGCPTLRSNSGGQGAARCGACSTPHYPDESEEHGPVENSYNNQEDKICQIPQR